MRVKGRILTFLMLVNSAFANVDCNNHKLPDLSGTDNTFIEDCTQKRGKSRICKCVKKNIKVNKASFPKKPKPSKEASKALNKLALDKVKTAYLATLDSFATLESSNANINNKDHLANTAPACHLKKSLPAIKCDNKDTLYSNIEREKMINDLKNQMHAEMLYYRKGLTPDKASGLTDANGNPQPGLIDRSKVSQNDCGVPLTDDFVNDMRNIKAENAIDLVVASPIMEELKKVDFNEAFKTLNNKDPEKYKSVNNVSFRDLINLTRNDVNSDVTKTDGLESQINTSPTLKDIMNNPARTEEILKRLKGENSETALSNYFNEVRLDQEEHKKLFKKLDKQCETINNNFKKVLCLPDNAKILSTSKAKALSNAELADETCEETNTCLSDDEFINLENAAAGEFSKGLLSIDNILPLTPERNSDSTIILANELCGEDLTEGKLEEVSLDLDDYIPTALRERKSFEEATNKNQELFVNSLANNICGLMPEKMNPADLDEFKKGFAKKEDFDEKVITLARAQCKEKAWGGNSNCKEKFGGNNDKIVNCDNKYRAEMDGCITDVENSLGMLYSEGGVYDSLLNTYQEQALAEVQAENADRELKPEEVDRLVEAKVKAKSKKLNTKDLMEEYSKIKNGYLGRKGSDYVAQMFEGPKERSKHQGRTEKAPEGNVYTAGKTSSGGGSTKNEGNKFNSANIKNAGRKIANAFSKKSISNGNIYNKIFDRARTNPNRTSTTPTGTKTFPPLTPTERRQAVDDAIGSFNPPPRPVERPQIDFDEQDRTIAAEIERDTNPDRTPRDFGGGGSPEIITRPELSPKEQAKKDYNDALQAANDAKEEAERRKLNPVPTSGVEVLKPGSDGVVAGSSGATSGAVVDLSKYAEKGGNGYDHSLDAVIADDALGISSDALDDLKGFLIDTNQNVHALFDSRDRTNIVHLEKEYKKVGKKKSKKDFKINVKSAPTSNEKKTSMKLFLKTIQNSRHVKNNFKDILNSKRTDSMYQKALVTSHQMATSF